MTKNPFITRKKKIHYVNKKNLQSCNDKQKNLTNQDELTDSYNFFPVQEEPSSDEELFLQHIGQTQKIHNKKYVLPYHKEKISKNITINKNSRNKLTLDTKIDKTNNQKTISSNKSTIQTSQSNILLPNDNLTENNTFLTAVKDVVPLSGKSRITTYCRPTKWTQTDITSLTTNKKPIKFNIVKKEEQLEGHIEGFDKKLFTQLQSGLFRPKTTLDLHGFNIQQAFYTVVKFLHTAYITGQQPALIISGRGKNSPQGIPVLKEKLYEWVTQEPLKRIILAFCTAHARDGGTGAIYILLRQYKKTWNIHWEQRPLDPDLL
ncbi:Smr/MutS family protein [Lawsonia intracellularis]|uniref:Smr/MutS family protein n=1 Tax=Lawsonia intracellularis TaxID=29546 RepID=UPI0021E57342|nr:Smr/MutS family protein [Lawsonia intracellularis]UYH53220.1 Smr/MutS family protein [Lawsonia intracellularis]